MTQNPYSSCQPINNLHSPFAQLFIEIQERIKAEVPAIQWCDQWWGQEQLEYRPAVAFPALLIDFPNTTFSAESQDSLFARVNISIRLLCDSLSSSAASATDASRADALQYYELEHDIIAALHCFTPTPCYQSLTLTGITTENRNPEYRIRNLSFSTAYELDVIP